MSQRVASETIDLRVGKRFSDQPPFGARHHRLVKTAQALAYGVVAFTALWGFELAIMDANTGLLHFARIFP